MSIPIFDPSKDGKGIWVIIHKKAIQATTDELKKRFIEDMNWYAENYPCNKCRKHLKKYIAENPFILYMFVTVADKDVGMFKWSWGCHNSVNERLNKEIITFETAYNLYDPTIVHPCTAGCEDEEEKIEEPKKVIKKEKLNKFKIAIKK
jgi:hypothetical protein